MKNTLIAQKNMQSKPFLTINFEELGFEIMPPEKTISKKNCFLFKRLKIFKKFYRKCKIRLIFKHHQQMKKQI